MNLQGPVLCASKSLFRVYRLLNLLLFTSHLDDTYVDIKISISCNYFYLIQFEFFDGYFEATY